MKLLMLLVAASLIGIGTAAAQTPVIPTSALLWDMAGPQDLLTIQGYTYRLYTDGASTGTALVGVTCAGTVAPWTCTVPFPPFSPGAHTVTITAGNLAGESAPSAAIAFTFVIVPSVPGNVRFKVPTKPE